MSREWKSHSNTIKNQSNKTEKKEIEKFPESKLEHIEIWSMGHKWQRTQDCSFKNTQQDVTKYRQAI